MQKTLALTLCLAATAASAQSYGPYGQAVARQEYCDLEAKHAEVTFRGKFYTTKAENYQRRKEQTDRTDRLGEIARFSIDYAYDQATDLRNAQMTVWAYCMDKLR